MRNYVIKSRRSRVNLIEAQKIASLPHRLSLCETPDEKRQLIAENNPLYYVFGYALNPKTYLETYTGETK